MSGFLVSSAVGRDSSGYGTDVQVMDFMSRSFPSLAEAENQCFS
jgi:hypothetical protein